LKHSVETALTTYRLSLYRVVQKSDTLVLLVQ